MSIANTDSRVTKRYRMLLLAMLVSLGGLSWSNIAKASCSPYAGGATFNEYYFGNADTNFLEIYIKDINVIPQAAWQNWTLRVYESSATFTDYVVNDSTATYCPFGSKAYITFDVPGGLPSPDISVALLDASGNEIDYLDACGPPGSCSLPAYYTPDPGSCAATDHDLVLDNLGNRDISRFPDGSGNWAMSAGTGSGTSFTACTTNTAGVTKFSSVAAVALGSNFTFTLEALNNSKKAETLIIEDNIPPGFSYVSSVPSQGTVDVSALPLLVWNTGALDKNGGTASLTITVTGSVLGTLNNTAVMTSPCADPLDCPRDTASVLVEAPSADHLAINHDATAVNCQAEPITLEAHNADHSINTAYSGTLNLSTSTANGDWSLISGLGTLNNGAVNDGIASYNMMAGDDGVVVLGLKDTVVETVNINVNDGLISETTGSWLASEDQDLAFAQTGFRFIDAASVASIGTQIAGKASSVAPGAQTLYLQAIRSSDDGVSCSGVFADTTTVNIDLGSICNNPLSCLAGQRVSITNNAITTAIANPQNQDAGLNYSSVPLTFSSNSRAPIVLNYADAGKIQLNARYNIPLAGGGPSGNLMTGNSNAFVVRPFGFDMDFSADRATNGISGVSYAADENASLFQIAGASFPLSLSAVVWNNTDDADNDGVPDACADLTDNAITSNFGNESTAVVPADVVLGNTLVAPAGGIAGTVSTSANSAAFVAGVGDKTIAWNEVGIMHLDTRLSNYLGSVQDVLANVCNVGRFYPNNFVINNITLTNRSDIIACPDPFTYMAENFSISYDLQATSVNPPGSITQNYINSFAKLDPAVLADINYGATDSGTNLSARLSAASAGVFTAGVAPVTASLSLSRNATPDGVYNNFQIGIVPADSDGVTLLLAALDLSLDGGPNTHNLLGQTDIRYGRLNLQNNFGSELLTLTMPLSAEYYLNATAEFITNIDDSCTTRTTADILLYNDQQPKVGRVPGNPVININGASNTTLTGVSAFVAGRSLLTFTAPGAEGYVDVEVQTPSWLKSALDGIDQGIQGPGMHCNPGLAGSDPAYIAGCVADGNSVDETPLSRGNFGLFKGGDNIIYIREIY